MDHLNTLNDLTPKIRCRGRNGVDSNILFGLESKLYLEMDGPIETHFEEVETITIYRDLPAPDKPDQPASLVKTTLDKALGLLSKEVVWRVKGFVRLALEEDKANINVYVVNWAFGRYDLTPLSVRLSDQYMVKLTVMGERGDVKKASHRFADTLGAGIL